LPTQSDNNYTCFQSIQAMFIPILGVVIVGVIALILEPTGIAFAVCTMMPLFLMVTLLFIYPVIHLISKIFGSHGSFRGIFIRTQWWNTVIFMLFVVIASLSNFYFIVRFLELIAISTPAVKTIRWSGLATILFTAMGMLWLVWVIAVSRVMAHHYQFTGISGCLTMALSHVIFSVAFFVLYIGLIFQVAWWMGYFL
jgi:hypothetical protein